MLTLKTGISVCASVKQSKPPQENESYPTEHSISENMLDTSMTFLISNWQLKFNIHMSLFC